jgi:outer membrane protein assembly factor BamA
VTGRLLAAAALACAAALPLAAQRYWKATLYPLPLYSTSDGLWLWGHYGRWSPVGFVERPEPYLAALNVDAGASTEGSHAITVDVQAPAWWDGWRVAATASVARANRLGYYGVGNATSYASDSVSGNRSYFYRVSRSTQFLRLTLQRRIAGPVRALAGLAATRSDFRLLPGESLFQRDVAGGVLDTAALPVTDVSGRVGLVFDTRDHEIDAHQGLFGELLYAAGDGYHRTTVIARAYVRPLERLTIAARVAGETVQGTAPLLALMNLESSDRPLETLGGYRSLRGYHEGRFIGAGKALAGVEARYALVWMPTLIEVKLVGFYETGRVFAPGERWRLTTDGLHPSGGVEVAARFQRNTLVATGAGVGDEGVRLFFGFGWSF